MKMKHSKKNLKGNFYFYLCFFACFSIMLTSCAGTAKMDQDIVYEFEKIPAIPKAEAKNLCQKAQQKILEKNYKKAIYLSQQVIRSTKNPLLLGRAYYLIGLAYQKLGNYQESLKYYRIVEQKYPESNEFRLALDGIFEIGSAWVHGRKRSFLLFFTTEDRERGIQILEKLVEKYPYLRSSQGKLLADDIYFTLGDIYYNWQDFAKARIYFQKVLDLYKDPEWKDVSAYKIAMSYIQETDLPKYDQENWKKARKKWEEYLIQFPRGDYAKKAREWIEKINETLARQDYRIGEYYYSQGKPLSAAIYFLSIIKEYKDTPTAKLCQKRLQEPWAKKALREGNLKP